MRDFLNHYFDWGRRHALLPYSLQEMVGRLVTPERYEPYAGPSYGTMQLIAREAFGETPWDALLAGKLPPRYRYRHFTVPKADGSNRELAEPGPGLKAMQASILRTFLSREQVHWAAVGYRPGKSIADHAWAHAGKRTVITADISDFFPSTRRYRVRAFWKDSTFAHNDADVQLLTNLTTYRGSLPQGAPTSPALSNIVNWEMDNRLTQIARGTGARYTRYADDLAFSWEARPRPPADFESIVRRVLREYGYRLNADKGWQIWSLDDEPEITGAVLTRRGTVDVPPDMRRRMNVLASSKDPGDAHRLAGYRGYRQMLTRRR